jgi:hypothetical protein
MSEHDKAIKYATKTPWCATEHNRAKWILNEHGERVLPPNDQKSNNIIASSEVMKDRDEPIGTSAAFPLGGGNDSPTGGITPMPSII